MITFSYELMALRVAKPKKIPRVERRETKLVHSIVTYIIVLQYVTMCSVAKA
jgi:hypothetical protein